MPAAARPKLYRSVSAWSYLPNPSARAGYETRSIFKRSLTGLNSEFSFSWTSCLTKAEEPSLSYYLPKAGGRIIGFIPFPRVLVLCEMKSFSSKIWTRVAVSIFYDDNNYTTGTSLVVCVCQNRYVIGVVDVGNCFRWISSASFLCQLEAVFFDLINRFSKHIV